MVRVALEVFGVAVIETVAVAVAVVAVAVAVAVAVPVVDTGPPLGGVTCAWTAAIFLPFPWKHLCTSKLCPGSSSYSAS